MIIVNCKTSSAILFINKTPLKLIIKIIDNSNISDCRLSKNGLHLNKQHYDRLS